MKILLVAMVPLALSFLAQTASVDDSRIIDTLIQIPYVVAFGWFVLRLADKQERFIRDTLEIILILCDEKRQAKPETLDKGQNDTPATRQLKKRQSTQDMLLRHIQGGD